MLERDRLFIGGDWVPPASDGIIEVISPHSEQQIGHAPDATEADVDAAVDAARHAFDSGPWPRMPLEERLEVLTDLHARLNERAVDFGTLITQQMGSPISWSVMAQAYASWMAMDYFLKAAPAFPWEQKRQGYLGEVLVRHEPVGVVAAVVPWNTPQFVTVPKIIPALIAGCSVVLKPAPETPLDALLFAELAQEAGLPDGVFNVVPAGRQAGHHLVSHPDIDKIGFTGSPGAGKAIAAAAAKNLTRVTLELGGKSAAIILDDADLETAVSNILPNAIMNNGQACVSQSRILAPRSRYDEVVNAFAEAVSALKVGDPMDEATEVGPMVAARQRDRVEKYIALGQEEGAEVVTGGGRPSHLATGWYVEPTVFANVDNSMRIAQEEIFGPVLSIIPYDDSEDAVRVANDSVFGLHGTVWTADDEAGLDIARRIRTGTFGVNTFGLDFGTPFGGFKESGMGREFGPEGQAAYTEIKTIHGAKDA